MCLSTTVKLAFVMSVLMNLKYYEKHICSLDVSRRENVRIGNMELIYAALVSPAFENHCWYVHTCVASLTLVRQLTPDESSQHIASSTACMFRLVLVALVVALFSEPLVIFHRTINSRKGPDIRTGIQTGRLSRMKYMFPRKKIQEALVVRFCAFLLVKEYPKVALCTAETCPQWSNVVILLPTYQ